MNACRALGVILLEFNADMREQMTLLVSEGLSCNAVAKRLGVSPSTISRHAKAAGLSFERSQTARAVEAARMDAAGRRAEVGAALLEDISRGRSDRLPAVGDAREFQQVAQGIAALARAYKDLALLPSPADNSSEDQVKASLVKFLALVKTASSEDQVLSIGAEFSIAESSSS